MDGRMTLRTPLKDINNGRNNTPAVKMKCVKMKRKKKSLVKQKTAQKTMLDCFKMDASSNQILKEPYTSPEKRNVSCFSRIRPSEIYDKPSFIKSLMHRANQFFLKDLRCPEFSPFSNIGYSCASLSSCERNNHKIISEQISDTQEKALTFLAKSWYMLQYPLTCLIRERVHLSPFVIRFLFYGILDEKDESICLRIKDIIKGHLKIHPPCNKKLWNLYYNVLVGDINNEDPSNPEVVSYNFKNILNKIENVLSELNNTCNITTKEEVVHENTDSFELPKDVDDYYQFFSDNYTKTGNILPLGIISSSEEFEEDEIDHEGLLKRLFIVFSLMVDILEENFRMWWMRSRYHLKKQLHSKRSFPIIAIVAWDKSEDRGLLNEHCIKVFNLFKSCSHKYKMEIARYITLLSEVVRTNEENVGMKFPFFSQHCNEFAEELTSYIKDENVINKETVSQVQLIYPSWLKFKVCGYILNSRLTSGGVDDLQSILKILQRNLSHRPKLVYKDDVKREVSKHSTIKDKKTDSSGETVVHKYCRANNYKALANLLRNKEVKVNIADNAGWTPLHNVAQYNSVDCLKLLVKYRGIEELNIFPLNSDNDSPLSCAVKAGNEEIVEILLNSGAGVAAWNIVSSGLSSVDHAQTEHLKDILIKGWTKSTTLYRNLNMTPTEIDLIYIMLTSYCDVYHVREHYKELDPNFCKHDSHYEFDYLQFYKDESTLIALYDLVEKLCTCRSNPGNLKNLLFFLKRRMN